MLYNTAYGFCENGEYKGGEGVLSSTDPTCMVVRASIRTHKSSLEIALDKASILLKASYSGGVSKIC